MNDKSLAGTLGTLGLMPKEGEGYTRINKDKLDELKQIGVDHQPFLDALFGGDATKRTEETKMERHTILGELDNTTTPFEAAQYTFGIPLAGIGTYLNELTTDVDILSAMGKLAAWERHYNNMESMLPSILLAMLLGGEDDSGNGIPKIPEGREPTGEEKYKREQQRYFEENFPYIVRDILGATIDYQGLSKKMKSELSEYCASPDKNYGGTPYNQDNNLDKKYGGQIKKKTGNPLDSYNSKYGYKGLYNQTECGG